MGAETTFNWLVALWLSQPELTKRLAAEAVSEPISMTQIAVAFCLDSAELCSKSHALDPGKQSGALKVKILSPIQDIAPAAGAPV